MIVVIEFGQRFVFVKLGRFVRHCHVTRRVTMMFVFFIESLITSLENKNIRICQIGIIIEV